MIACLYNLNTLVACLYSPPVLRARLLKHYLFPLRVNIYAFTFFHHAFLSLITGGGDILLGFIYRTITLIVKHINRSKIFIPFRAGYKYVIPKLNKKFLKNVKYKSHSF